MGCYSYRGMNDYTIGEGRRQFEVVTQWIEVQYTSNQPSLKYITYIWKI